MPKKLFLIILLLISLSTYAQNTPDSLFNSFWNDYLTLNPSKALELGDKSKANALENELTNNYLDFESKLYQSYYIKAIPFLAKANTKTATDLNLFIALLEQGKQDNFYRIITRHYWMNHYYNPVSLMAQQAENRSLYSNTSDIEDYLHRLELFCVKIDTAIVLMKNDIISNNTQPRITIEKSLPQIETHLQSAPLLNSFYKPIVNLRDSLSNIEFDVYFRKVDSVYAMRLQPQLQKLYDFLKTEYLPVARTTIGLCDQKSKVPIYAYYVRKHTTTKLSADSIYAIGLNEIKTLNTKTQALKLLFDFQGGNSAFFQFLRSDSNMYYKNKEALLKQYEVYKIRIDSSLPKLFNIHPKHNYIIKPIEAFREKAKATAQYQAPSFDGKQPGIFYVNTFNLSARPKYNMAWLTLHEASPGHHYQYSLQYENVSLPSFRKYTDYTAFSEGWALYCERLGYDLGLYKDKYQEAGALSAELWRSARLVVDVGIHAKHWTREQAVGFLLENTALTQTEAEAEVDRYIANPGQALAYKIGQLKILELKKKEEKRLGKKFDIKTFHDNLLKQGAVPLELISAH